jgi:glycosyltransferase involved in cell wall biosynthesis
VLFLGGLERRKGVDMLLEAFEAVARSHPDAELRLAGAGSLEGEIRARAAREPLAGRVTLLGRVGRAEVPALLRSSTLLAVPSLGEPFGMSALEALASGLPVAAFPVPGPRDILEGSGAGALDLDLGAAVKKALALPAAHCRTVAGQFSWRAATEQFLRNLAPFGSI